MDRISNLEPDKNWQKLYKNEKEKSLRLESIIKDLRKQVEFYQTEIRQLKTSMKDERIEITGRGIH